MLQAGTLPGVSLLKGCTNLVSLTLGGDGLTTPDLETLDNDNFRETVAWLRECIKLRVLVFTNFFSGLGKQHPFNFTRILRLRIARQ